MRESDRVASVSYTLYQCQASSIVGLSSSSICSSAISSNGQDSTGLDDIISNRENFFVGQFPFPKTAPPIYAYFSAIFHSIAVLFSNLLYL